MTENHLHKSVYSDIVASSWRNLQEMKVWSSSSIKLLQSSLFQNSVPSKRLINLQSSGLCEASWLWLRTLPLKVPADWEHHSSLWWSHFIFFESGNPTTLRVAIRGNKDQLIGFRRIKNYQPLIFLALTWCHQVMDPKPAFSRRDDFVTINCKKTHSMVLFSPRDKWHALEICGNTSMSTSSCCCY